MEQFCFKRESETLFLRGAGRLTSQNCQDFKKTVFSCLDNATLRHVLFDLSQCDYMDSTFLGMIVGIYKKMRSQGNFSIVQPSPAALQHLHSMGMDRLIPIQTAPGNFPAEMGICSNKPTVEPEEILNAHKNLRDISHENKEKFSLLIDVLENQIVQKSKPVRKRI